MLKKKHNKKNGSWVTSSLRPQYPKTSSFKDGGDAKAGENLGVGLADDAVVFEFLKNIAGIS